MEKSRDFFLDKPAGVWYTSLVSQSDYLTLALAKDFTKMRVLFGSTALASAGWPERALPFPTWLHRKGYRLQAAGYRYAKCRSMADPVACSLQPVTETPRTSARGAQKSRRKNPLPARHTAESAIHHAGAPIALPLPIINASLDRLPAPWPCMIMPWPQVAYQPC